MISAKTTLLGLAAAGLLALLFVHCPCRKTLASTTPMAAGALGKTVSDVKWTGCDGKDGLATINNIIITGTFTADTDINIRVQGVWKATTHMESLDASIKLGFVTVFEETIAYPEDTVTGQPFDLGLTTALYIDAPSGSYKATLRMKDTPGAVLQCVLITFKLS